MGAGAGRKAPKRGPNFGPDFKGLPQLAIQPEWAGCTLLLVSYLAVCGSLDCELWKASGTHFEPVPT